MAEKKCRCLQRVHSRVGRGTCDFSQNPRGDPEHKESVDDVQEQVDSVVTKYVLAAKPLIECEGQKK